MDYIEIKGYKSIKSQRVELKLINIMIGANGSGKSNFLSFFEFLYNLYNRKLNEYVALRGGLDKILHKGRKNLESLEFKMEFDKGTNGYSAKLVAGDEGFVFTAENLIFKGNSWEISAGSEAQIKISSVIRATYIIQYLNGFRKYHFHDTGSSSPFTTFSDINNDIHNLYQNGSNIAAFLFDIQKKDKIVYNRIIKNIQSIAPYFSDFFLSPNSEGKIRLQWQDKFSDIVYGPNDLSDGTLRFIALSVLFLQPTLPDTIIIDEPELGLHPAAIAKLSAMIQSVAAKKCQVIVATQSTDLISHFMPEDIITVDQIDGETQFERLSSQTLERWLEDYTIDDLWKRNIITQGQPN